MNRDRKTFWVKTVPVITRQEFPTPFDCIFTEVITDREVSEHLEERMVTRCFPDVFDIVRPD